MFRRLAGCAGRSEFDLLPAELACGAPRTEEEDLVPVVELVLVGLNDVAAPTESSFIGLKAAFRTDE